MNLLVTVHVATFLQPVVAVRAEQWSIFASPVVAMVAARSTVVQHFDGCLQFATCGTGAAFHHLWQFAKSAVEVRC